MDAITPSVDEEAEAKQGFRVTGPGSSPLGPRPGLLGACLSIQHFLIICMRKKICVHIGRDLKDKIIQVPYVTCKNLDIGFDFSYGWSLGQKQGNFRTQDPLWPSTPPRAPPAPHLDPRVHHWPPAATVQGCRVPLQLGHHSQPLEDSKLKTCWVPPPEFLIQPVWVGLSMHISNRFLLMPLRSQGHALRTNP